MPCFATPRIITLSYTMPQNSEIKHITIIYPVVACGIIALCRHYYLFFYLISYRFLKQATTKRVKLGEPLLKLK